jgi:cytochrome c oxidase subunit 2
VVDCGSAGNDASAEIGNASEAGPVVNATAAPAVTNKPATQNPAGLGQTGN